MKSKAILKSFLSIIFYIFRIFKVNNKQIMFINFNGKGYGENPKYILESLYKENKDLKFIWTVDHIYNDMPKTIKQVKYLSIKWFYYMTTSKVWINNTRFSSFVKKRKKQLYIQTWHGGIPIKKIEYDAVDLPLKYKVNMKNDSLMTDYMLSNSKFSTALYRNAFKYNGKILECGTPRNDVLINDIDILKDKALKYFNLSGEELVIAYLPTFRSSYEKNPYDIDFNKLIAFLSEKYNKEVKVLVKLHPVAISKKNLIQYSKNVIDASNYPDIQELIAVSNWVITDYSSIMFEAMIARKVVSLYANDIECYKEDRGFYFKFEDLPFKLAKNNDELLQMANTIDLNSNNYDEFRKKLGLIENGNASLEVAGLILKFIQGDKNE